MKFFVDVVDAILSEYSIPFLSHTVGWLMDNSNVPNDFCVEFYL